MNLPIQGLKRRKEALILVIFLTMGVLIVLQVNNSSMAAYASSLPNNASEAAQLVVGIPRAVRSDEFLISTSGFFHDQINGQLTTQGFTKNSGSIIVWINNVITLLNPYYWGELYLPASYALSWNFITRLFFSLYAFYRLFQIIIGNKGFSVLASLLLAFAPGFQWWGGPSGFGVLCGVVVFFYDFFCADKMWKKILYAWGLVCCASAIVPSIYPVWSIPYMYLLVFVLIGIYATQRRINFKKTDIPYIAITCLLMLVIVAAYFISSADTMQSMLETIYPGRRFSSGGNLESSYWAHYLVAPLTPWKMGNMPLNQSEISHFLHFFPIPIVVFVSKYQDFRKRKVIKALVCFNILCDIYMVFGIGDFIAKYTLWNYTTSMRLHIVWGLSSFILLLLECYYIVPKKPQTTGKVDWIKCGFVNSCIAAFLIWVAVSQKPLMDYIEAGNFIYISVGVILLGNLLFFGKKKIFILSMCVLTIISGVVVNPINFGTSIMTDTPLAEEIREIDQQDPGRWVVLEDLTVPKYVYAQGVDCLNYLSWPPRFDLFEPLDEDGEFRNIYNRYAHVVVNLTMEETSFLLNQDDYITVFLNANDLQKWDVKYVVIRGGLPERMGNVEFEMLYYDALDNVNIYKADYDAE